jgi:hypothetical protein
MGIAGSCLRACAVVAAWALVAGCGRPPAQPVAREEATPAAPRAEGQPPRETDQPLARLWPSAQSRVPDVACVTEGVLYVWTWATTGPRGADAFSVDLRSGRVTVLTAFCADPGEGSYLTAGAGAGLYQVTADRKTLMDEQARGGSERRQCSPWFEIRAARAGQAAGQPLRFGRWDRYQTGAPVRPRGLPAGIALVQPALTCIEWVGTEEVSDHDTYLDEFHSRPAPGLFLYGRQAAPPMVDLPDAPRLPSRLLGAHEEPGGVLRLVAEEYRPPTREEFARFGRYAGLGLLDIRVAASGAVTARPVFRPVLADDALELMTTSSFDPADGSCVFATLRASRPATGQWDEVRFYRVREGAPEAAGSAVTGDCPLAPFTVERGYSEERTPPGPGVTGLWRWRDAILYLTCSGEVRTLGSGIRWLPGPAD